MPYRWLRYKFWFSAISFCSGRCEPLSTFRSRPLRFTSHLAARLMLAPYPIHPIYPDAHAPALMHKGRELLMKLLYRLDWLHRVDPVERDGDLLCVGSVYRPMASAVAERWYEVSAAGYLRCSHSFRNATATANALKNAKMVANIG